MGYAHSFIDGFCVRYNVFCIFLLMSVQGFQNENIPIQTGVSWCKGRQAHILLGPFHSTLLTRDEQGLSQVLALDWKVVYLLQFLVGTFAPLPLLPHTRPFLFTESPECLLSTSFWS